MAWSAKLQSGIGGTAGYNEWETVYDASTQTAYKLKYGFSLGNQAPDVLYHTPDNGSPVPVRANGANRLIFLTVDVPTQANWDTVNEKVAALARLIDGPYSQAVRAQTTGDANKVRVAIKPTGATYTTYYEVLHGFMDTSQAFTESAAVLNTMARNITIALTCAPFGYGDEFTLKNMLASSPHFIVDSDSDGLADGWNKTGTPTVSISTNRYLIGGKSQKFITDASSAQGIYSNTVTASISSTIVAKVYLATDDKDKISIVLRDGSGNVIQLKDLQANDAGGIATRTHIGNDGETWYEISVTGTNSTAANCYLQIQRSSANATQACQVWVDGAYLTTGTTTAPVAFSSGYTLTNNAVDWLDFWGIPGDVPALINLSLSSTGTNDEGFVFGRRTDGKQLASAIRYLVDSPFFAGGVFSVSSNYIRATSSGASGSYFASADNITPADDPAATARAIGDTIFKLYVVGRSSSTTNTLYAQYGANGSEYIDTDTVSATTANTWELWDLGIVNPTGLVVNQSITSSFYLRFQATVSGSLDIDYAILLPVTDEYLIVDGNPRTIYGTLKQITYSVGYTASFLSTWRGSMWQMPCGPQMTRIIYHDFGTSNAVTAGNTLEITTTVTPRTSHLLGTK